MTSLLHVNDDPTMDTRIIHAVNVSNKKHVVRLNHMEKSLAGSRDVALHIYRQEEKELVKQLFKLQQEKQRRHPEIEYRRRSDDKLPDTEYLIKSLDLTHRGASAAHTDHQLATQDSHQDPGSHMSLIQQYLQDAVYQPIGYGHGRNEYTGLEQDTTRRRSVPEEKFISDFRNQAMTSHTALSHPIIDSALENIDQRASAMPSRHRINVNFHPHRQQSHSLAFLEPETHLKKADHSSEVPRSQKEHQHTDTTVLLQKEQKHGSLPSMTETSMVDEMRQQSGHLLKQKSKSRTGDTFKDKSSASETKIEHRKSSIEDPHTKRRTVMFAVKTPSSAHSSEPLHSETTVFQRPIANRVATRSSNSSMESMYDDLSGSRRGSAIRAVIEQEHQKVDSIVESFRKAFPVKKEQQWQRTHPRSSEASQRGPFVAHTPPHGISNQQSSTDKHAPHSHGVDHQHHQDGAHLDYGIPRSHQDRSHYNVSRKSIANVSRHEGTSHDATHESLSNTSHDVRRSHFNVARNQRQSPISMGPHNSNVSQKSVGRRDVNSISIYNMPKEAIDDYHNLLDKASYNAHHPSTREAHAVHQHADIPHSHQPKSHLKRSRQKLLALHLLANQQRQQRAAAAAEPPKFDPQDALMCRYLRLSALNIETLVDMCRESGVNIGIHPHMSVEDLTNFVFPQNSVEDKDTSIARDNEQHHHVTDQ